ncbi:MAG: O-antigen ligase family protein [Candidatus Eremiobacteraeota bacterium]|nr:O-antigen ligase family protein [Candidatus Eremiobacteraeota bacterium]
MKNRTAFISALSLFVIPLAFLPNIDDAFVLPKRFLLYSFVVLLLLESVFSRQEEGEGIAVDLPNLLAIALVIFVGLATWLSPNPLLGQFYVLDIFCLVLLFIFFRSYLDRESIRNSTFWLVLAGVITSFYALGQHLGWDPVIWIQHDLVRSRSIGTMGNPDFLAGLLALILPLALAITFTTGEKWKERLGFIAVGIIMLAGLLTYCRGGWLAMAAGILVFFLLSGKNILKNNSQKIITVIVIIVTVFLSALVYESVFHKGSEKITGRIISAFGDDRSVSARKYLWKTAVHLVRERPLLGWGPEYFPFGSLRFRYLEPVDLRYRLALPESAHNDYLDLAVSCGIPALFLFLGIIFMSVRATIPRIKGVGGERIFYSGMLGALMGFSVHVFFVYSTLGLLLPFWFVVASCLSSGPGSKKLSSVIYRVSSAVFLLFFLIVLFFLFKNIQADFIFKTGNNLVGEGRTKEAVIHFERASFIYPFKPAYFRIKGKALEGMLRKKFDLELAKRSIQAYEKVINLTPDDPFAYADLGRLCSFLANMNVPAMRQYAIDNYKIALSLDPYNNYFHNDIANVYLDDKDYDRALDHYNRSIELYPYDSKAYTNIGICYKRMGKYREAEKYFKKALELDRDYKKARQLLEEMRSRGENRKVPLPGR